MNTISINVPGSLAKVFENANEEKKKKAEQYIGAWLKAFLSKDAPDDRLIKVMQQASDAARKNGMTPEKMEELLKDE